eukprot:2472925-Amphidinium_carterae.3
MDHRLTKRHSRILTMYNETHGAIIIPWHLPGLCLRKTEKLFQGALPIRKMLLIAVSDGSPILTQALLRTATISSV